MNGSNVYATFLDASKAFDRVKFDCLFELLLDKKICPVVARLLAFIYTNQSGRIKWNGSVSLQFSILNGVKQGGVLSPFLFNIYLDVLLRRLKKSGFGCHYGHKYTGSLAYADDVVLLSPTLGSLNEMLKICEKYSEEYDLVFNGGKTKMLIFGENVQDTKVIFQGKTINTVQSESHVGNIISTDCDVEHKRIKKACNELYAQFNLLLLQFGICSPNVIYRLYNSYCMSLYGSQLWNYDNEKIMESLYAAWRKCVRRIFKVPYNTHCSLVHLVCNDSSIQVKLHKRFLKFFICAYESENNVVSIIAKGVLEGSRSHACASLNKICSLYNLDKYSLTNACLQTVLDTDAESNIVTAAVVTDFLAYRRSHPDDSDVTEIIEFLCTT